MKSLIKTNGIQTSKGHRILRSVAVAIALIALGAALGFC